MTREESKEFLITISYKFGNMSIEYLTEKDGEKMREAIKALEQQTCEDAVSREAVLGLFAQNADATRPYSTAWEKIRDLPSVNSQPKTGWIPVSEGLPSDGKYLVTRGDVIGRPMIGIRYFNKDLSKVDDFDFVDKKGISGWYEYDSEYGWYIDDKVIAWMPLPELYKAESEG